MRVWLIQIGEPLPVDGEAPRLLRTGIISQQLARRGHEVTWWCSTFNHWTKSHRSDIDTTIELEAGYRLRLLHSPGYSRNVSLARIADHRILARKLEDEMEREALPHVILSSFPAVEMSEVATRFGRKRGVPVIVDVRDLWPDAFLNFVPSMLRPLAKLSLVPMYRAARRALRASDAIVAVSESYLEWGLHMAQRRRRDTDAIFPLGYERSLPMPAQMQAAGERLRNAGVDPERIICWYIGTFGRTYDLHTVIEAARVLHNEGDTRAQFVLSGDGDSLDECRELAAGLENVVFTGWLNSTEIECMMNLADIGLAAYVRDAPQSLPNKLFEYLAAELPILSSLGAEAADLLERNGCGFTYESGRPETLLEPLTRLLADPGLLHTMSASSRNTFDAKYSAKRVYEPFVGYLERFGAERSSDSGIVSSEGSTGNV